MLVPELADIEIVDRVEYQYLTVLIPRKFCIIKTVFV